MYGVKSDWAPVVSGVPQGTVFGPLLFPLHINDITADTESEIRLYADDCVCYREINLNLNLPGTPYTSRRVLRGVRMEMANMRENKMKDK